MTVYSEIQDEALYVVCREHNIRYPAVCYSCPNCPKKTGSMQNRSHDDPRKVEVCES